LGLSGPIFLGPPITRPVFPSYASDAVRSYWRTSSRRASSSRVAVALASSFAAELAIEQRFDADREDDAPNLREHIQPVRVEPVHRRPMMDLIDAIERHADGAIRLSEAQLGLWLEGLDWPRVPSKPVIAPLMAG
jgi:hypothetical protein